MRRVLAAGLVILLPIVVAVVLLFGGGQVNQCLGLGCARPADTSGPLDEASEVASVGIVLVAVWIGIVILACRFVWSVERGRLARALGAIIVVTAAAAVITAVSRILALDRLRVVAEDAGLYALGALLVTVPIALAWATLTAKDSSTDTSL